MHKRLFFATTATASSFLLCMAFVAIPAGSSSAAPQKVMLVNRQTGKCATVAGGVRTDNNVPLVQFVCDTHPSRRWYLINGGYNGQTWIRNVGTGKCMTIAGGTLPDNNLELVQFTCDNDPSRAWAGINKDGTTDSWQLLNLQSRKCATVAGGVTTDNNHPLVQFSCDSDPSRYWYVVPVP
ncbi:RICIN domain-containing protein [Nonomuraea sp. NPDC050536]|uniref:RICIN domain-containing protein n=1 Tax=Nonomuraea sp. NPDC050536 TaxID=3364366 RepID=UPI0037C5C442